MSPRILFLLFLLVAAAAAAGRCGPNQTWKSCGTACPARCNQPRRTFCTTVCKTGCQCNRGFLLNKQGKCVLPKNC